MTACFRALHEIGFPMTNSCSFLGLRGTLTDGNLPCDRSSRVVSHSPVKPPFSFLMSPPQELPETFMLERRLIQGFVDRFMRNRNSSMYPFQSPCNLFRTPAIPKSPNDKRLQHRIIQLVFIVF